MKCLFVCKVEMHRKVTSLVLSAVIGFALIGLTSCDSSSPIFSKKSTLSKKVENLVDSLKSFDYISTAGIGRTPNETPAYLLRMNLLETASNKELDFLVDHPKSEIAVIGFEGLVQRSAENMQLQLYKFKGRKGLITFIKGDMFLPMSCLEYCYTIVLGNS